MPDSHPGLIFQAYEDQRRSSDRGGRMRKTKARGGETKLKTQIGGR